MDDARLLAPGEGESIRSGFQIKAGREELVLTETWYEAGQLGPDPHIHRQHVDAFHLLDGELEFLVEAETLRLGAGAFVLIPPEVVHTFRNPGPERAPYLNVHAPGVGFDEYLRSGFETDFDQEDPPADGGRPGCETVIRRPGEGERLSLGGSEATIKAGAGDGLGSIALIELELGPGFPAPVPHRHERMVDSFYVLAGELTITLGGEPVAAGAGSCALVPPGNAHTFANPRNERVRLLNLMAPGGLEGYLREVAAEAGPPDPARMAEIASGYDFRAIYAQDVVAERGVGYYK